MCIEAPILALVRIEATMAIEITYSAIFGSAQSLHASLETSRLRLGAPLGHVCYDNGVKLLFSLSAAGVSNTRVTKPDGSICYELEAQAAGTGRPLSFTYKDASGALIATGTYDNAMTKATVTCPGEAPAEVSLRCRATTAPLSAAMCTSGTCD
jgi:hypothetical protein